MIKLVSAGDYWRGWKPKRLAVVVDTIAQAHKVLRLPGATETKDPQLITFPAEPRLLPWLQRSFGDAINVDSGVQDWLERQTRRDLQAGWIRTQKKLPPISVPWGKRLYEYQTVGAQWLQFTGFGILADEVGLGKTIESITACWDLRNVLIVTLNTLKPQWRDQIKLWTGKDAYVAVGARSDREAVLEHEFGWFIINHEMLRLGKHAFPALRSRTWDAVIIDEAHKLQGRDSLQSRGAERLKTDRLYMLTGTPIWSRSDSLWHLLSMLDPYRFTSYWNFIAEFYDTTTPPWGGTQILGVKDGKLEELQRVVEPYILRRKKSDVAIQLPAKIRQRWTWYPTPEQLKLYRKIRKELVLPTTQGERRYPHAGAAMSDARLLLDAPELVDVFSPSPKTKLLQDLLASTLGENQDQKAIIFTWHVKYARYLEDRLGATYPCVCVTGEDGEAEREAKITKFRKYPEVPLMIATISSLGTGLDLVEANVAIFAEGSYVPVENSQAEGRLHRIGQKTDVTIYRLQAAKTVEQIVWDVSDEREELADELLAFHAVIDRAMEED